MEAVDYNKLARKPREWARAARQNRKRILEKWNVPIIETRQVVVQPIASKPLIYGDKAFIRWEAKCKD